MGKEVAIKVEKISKVFKLPHEKASSIKSVLVNVHRRDKGYDLQQALDDVSFEINKGEFFGIIGRNGSGKSTLLKIIAGIYQPTAGKVDIDGRLVPFIELGVGFNPELTGRENVYLNGALFGFSRKEIDRQYNDIVAFAELKPFMEQKLKNYSSGMQVRLAFSMAVRPEADILLIDEVLAVGDADFQRKCVRYFKKLKKDKKTVVLVTHDMDAVREYCDRAMLIDKQKIVTIGTPDQAARDYTKIMTPTTVEETGAEEADRWGDGTVRIDSIKIDGVTTENLNFSFTASARRNCPDPVFGFRIRNAEGQSILGTNSSILGQKPVPLKKGQKITVSWELQNIFAEGDYYIDPSVVYEGTSTAADWWDNAQTFRIDKGRHTPYLVQPDVKLAVNIK